MQRSYEIFEESITSEATKDYYKKHLATFFEFTKSKSYDSLIHKDPKAIQIKIEDYVMYLKKRCRLGNLNPNSVPVMLAPVFMFCEQNDVIINSKKIKRMFPERIAPKGEKPYTTDEIRKMLDVTNLRGKALIHFMSSTGGRPAVIDDPILRCRHITDMGNGIWCFKVYEGSLNEDYIFTIPEATKAIQEYFNSRKLRGEKMTDESPVFVDSSNARPLKSQSARLIIYRLLRKIGKRKSGQNPRIHYDQAIFYGFRKRFNTILNKVGVKPSYKEKLMLHKQTMDGKHYFKPTKEELLEEFRKAIPELTINESFRLKEEIKIKNEVIENSESKKDALIKDYGERLRNTEQLILSLQKRLDSKIT